LVRATLCAVMPSLVPGIRVLFPDEDVDGRHVRLAQRGREIGDEIIGILDADREPH
jgi:hypothetical protein